MLGTTPVGPFYRNHLIRDAIGAALYDAMKTDPAIHLFGEGAHVKMHYDAPQTERDFADRVHTMPIAEDGIVNFAVGASLLGVKPVVDIITADFLYRAMDSICNTAAKLNFVLPDSEPPRTIVIRAEFLMGGPTTGQRPEMLFARIPGLNVVVPSTPRDAYALMRQALKHPGVTVFFEDRLLLDTATHPGDLLSDCNDDMAVWGKALRRRPVSFTAGHGLTVVAYGLMRQRVEAILDEEGITNVDLLDLPFLHPLDIGAIVDSVQETEKLLIVEPDCVFGGIGSELVAQLHERLDTPFKAVRLGAPRETIPANREGQARMLPSRAQILEAIHALLG